MATRRFSPPTRVSVICYLLFARSAILLVEIALWVFFPRPYISRPWLTTQVALTDVALAVVVGICAAFMLTGANWARILFLVSGVADILQLIFIHYAIRDQLEFAGITLSTLVLGGALFTHRASRFFAGKDYGRTAPKPSSLARGERTRPNHFDY